MIDHVVKQTIQNKVLQLAHAEGLNKLSQRTGRTRLTLASVGLGLPVHDGTYHSLALHFGIPVMPVPAAISSAPLASDI